MNRIYLSSANRWATNFIPATKTFLSWKLCVAAKALTLRGEIILRCTIKLRVRAVDSISLTLLINVLGMQVAVTRFDCDLLFEPTREPKNSQESSLRQYLHACS